MFVYKYLSNSLRFFINFSLNLFFRATNIYAYLESLVLFIGIFLNMLFPGRKSIQPCRSVSLWCCWFPALIQGSFLTDNLSSGWRFTNSTHIRMIIHVWTPSPFIVFLIWLKCELVLILFKINFILLFVPSR